MEQLGLIKYQSIYRLKISAFLFIYVEKSSGFLSSLKMVKF